MRYLSEIQMSSGILHLIWQPKYKEKPTEPITEPDLYPFRNLSIVMVLPFTDFQGYHVLVDWHHKIPKTHQKVENPYSQSLLIWI